jgi:hypothetical protein
MFNAGAAFESTLWYALNFRNHLYGVITHKRDQHYHLFAVKARNSLEFIAISWNIPNDMYGETSLRWTGYETHKLYITNSFHMFLPRNWSTGFDKIGIQLYTKYYQANFMLVRTRHI